MSTRLWLVGLVVVVATLPGIQVGNAAELAPAQRDKLVWIDQQLQKCVTLYKEHKTDDLKKLIGEIETAINGLQTDAADPTLEPVLNPFRARLAAAQKLSDFVPPTLATAPRAPVPKKPKPGDTAMGGVSFSKQIAPFLIAKCNGCHVNRNDGNVSVASFKDIMDGIGAGLPLLIPGKSNESRLVEVLVSNEMPKNANKATEDEIKTIMKWIDEGAKFDGADPMMGLAALTGTGTPATRGPTPIAIATGSESVHFMRDVMPILIDNCMDCHGSQTGQNAGGRYSFYSFNSLMGGGQNERKAITPGDAEGSFFVKMLRGKALNIDGKTPLPQMPRRRSPLDDATMKVLLTWINEGAKFDGDDTRESLQLLWDINQAKKMTHEELLAARMARAKSAWPKANPDSPFELIEAGDFTILGNLGSVRMQEFVKQAQDERNKIVGSLKLPAGQPIVKGRITLLVFDKKFEYAEWGRVAEGRELAADQLAHWKFNFIDSYGCIVNQGNAEDTAPLISEIIAGAYLDSLDSAAPRWFAVGTARNIASKIHGKSMLTKQWQDGLATAMGSGISSNAVVSARNPDGNVAALSQGFVKEMMKSPAWTLLMSSISKGNKFDAAFQQAYRSDPDTLMKNWMGR